MVSSIVTHRHEDRQGGKGRVEPVAIDRNNLKMMQRSMWRG